MDEGCSCHISPPCSFCTSLTEEEADVYAKGGLDALRKYRQRQKDLDEYEATRGFLDDGSEQRNG